MRDVSKPVSESVEYWVEDTEDGSNKSIIEDYRRYISRKIIFIIVCVFIAIVTVGLALTYGPYKIGFLETYDILWHHIINDIIDEEKDAVVWDMRLPRIAAGLIAGAGLAVAGAAMQSVLKNPLADPYTTGISSGALFGASLSIAFGMRIVSGEYGTIINAFVFSLVPTLVIVLISKLRNSSPTTMVMAGIAVMYIFNSITTVVKLWADPNALSDLYRWQVGSLYNIHWSDLPLMFTFTILGSLALFMVSKKLNILSMGDDTARSMGINADNLRIMCLVVVALISASIVSYTGLIGFVGLVVPHIVRLFVGSDNRFAIPASLVFGSAFLVVCDQIGRALFQFSLEVGVVTSFIGGPMFLYLILRRRRSVN